MVVACCGCATLDRLRRDLVAGKYLDRSEKLLAEGNFGQALEENQKTLFLFPQDPPGDIALFNMGLIYVHPANPDKDYVKARGAFIMLTTQFPGGELAQRARMWLEVLLDLEHARQVARESEIQARNRIEILEQEKEGLRRQLESGDELLGLQELLARGEFRKAVRENKEVLSRYGKKPLSDSALFNMGLIYAHFANPDRNYKQSLFYFKQLVRDFPESSLAEQAKIWVDMLQVIEKTKQVDILIEEKKKELTR